MLNNNLPNGQNRELVWDDVPRPNQYVRRSIEERQGIPAGQGANGRSNASSIERNGRVQSQLNDLKESLLAFTLFDKLFCTITLLGVYVMVLIYVTCMKGEDGWMNCIGQIKGIAMLTKEQVMLAGVVTEFLLLNCIYTLIVQNKFWNSVLHKQLGFLQWQWIWGLVVLLVKIALVLACYTYFDFDAKIIMFSMIPLCYHYIYLTHLAEYISEIKIEKNTINVNFHMQLIPTNKRSL